MNTDITTRNTAIATIKVEAADYEPTEPGKILRIRPRWMEGWANRPSLEAQVTPFDERGALWEVRGGTYRSQIGDVVHRMYTDGKPNQGFGGHHFTLNMIDGSIRTFIGAWSSNASSVSSIYPDKPCTECSVCEDDEVWEKGYTFTGRDVCTMALLGWWWIHQDALDWGLAVVQSHYGSVDIEPTKGQYVKYEHGGTPPKVLDHIYPAPTPKNALFPRNKIDRVVSFFQVYQKALRAGTGGDPSMSGEQNVAIRA